MFRPRADAENERAHDFRGGGELVAGSEHEIGVALLGYGFMGRAHSYAIQRLGALAGSSRPRLRAVSVGGRSASKLERARQAYGWEEAETDWRSQLSDPRVGLFANVAPNHMHVEPTIHALAAGKHVLCEKPLAPTADQALRMLRAAEATSAVSVCGFNYRFLPAIEIARSMIARGDLGEITHFRARFLQRTGIDEPSDHWRLRRDTAGSGVLGDLGSHHVDLARLLVGEPVEVMARVRAWRHAGADVESAVQALICFEDGAMGTIEASSLAGGHVCTSVLEVDGTAGSLRFELSRLNELEVLRPGSARVVATTDPSDPFMDVWFPAGHPIGWGDSFTHMWDHLARRIADDPVEYRAATFLDGYRCAEICAAIGRAADSGHAEHVTYRA